MCRVDEELQRHNIEKNLELKCNKQTPNGVDQKYQGNHLQLQGQQGEQG